MTRVAGVPEELRGVAACLHGTAGDLQTLAERLASLSYPEMPPGTDALVGGLVGSAGSRLRRDAILAETCNGDVKKRAAWFELADALIASPAVQAPREVTELLANSLDLAERLRVGQMLKEWNRWNRLVPQIIEDYGEESGAATNIWFSFQERSPLAHDAFLKMLEGAGETEDYAAAADVPLAGLRLLAGRTLGPLGIVTNFLSVVHPEHDGWRGDVDRATGVLGMGGSAGITALALGAETIPGLDVAATVVLLGVGGWQLGNLIYDNRTAVARTVVGGARYAYDHAGYAVGGPIGQIAWEHRGDAVRAAVSAATWGADHAESLADTAVGVAAKGLHEGGTVVHDVGSGLKTLGGLL